MIWLRRKRLASRLVKEHFPNLALHELVTATREFPITARADLQLALDDLFNTRYKPAKFVGIHSQYGHETITFANVVDDSGHASIGPLQYDEVDIGEPQAARCLKTALWMSEHKGAPFALLLTQNDWLNEPSRPRRRQSIPRVE
jgi:hypothetical protein